MSLFLLRLTGAALGAIVTHIILLETILVSRGGEASIGLGMWFWFGGWMVVLFYYALGTLIGAVGILPLINWCGTCVLGLVGHIRGDVEDG